MKQILMAGALVLGLVACGTGSKTAPPDDTTPPPDTTTSPYNPAPSAVESKDPRVPYYGDWVWAAKLPDGSYRLGVASINARGTETDKAKNGGYGAGDRAGYQCQDETCAVPYQKSYAVISTLIVDGEAKLSALFSDPASTSTPPTSRLSFLDADSRIEVNAQNNPVIAGAGGWVEVTGQPEQTARAAFVQVDATPDLDFGGTLPDAFAQAKAAADGVVTAQRVNSVSLLELQRMVPAPK